MYQSKFSWLMCFKSKHIFIVTTTNYLIKWTLENFANLQKKIDIFLNSFLFWFVKLSHCSITFGNGFSLSSFNLLSQKRIHGWCSISRLNMINVKFWYCLRYLEVPSLCRQFSKSLSISSTNTYDTCNL